MSYPIFPTLPGLAWAGHKRPTFSTRVASHMSGREVRSPLYAHPLYEFELDAESLDSLGNYPALGSNSYQALLGLFLSCQGQALPFLYFDPSDNAVTGQVIGTGDGSTTTFQLIRSVMSASDPVLQPISPAIYLNGGLQTSGYAISTGINSGLVTFASAPGAGVGISWTGTFYWICRFLDDQMDFENFMAGLWSAKSIKFRALKG